MHVMSSVSPANDNSVAAATSPPPSGFSHICENGPRPPNPPPPPPPPLPLHPGLRDEAPHLKKRRVRSFFWKTIPEDQVKGRLNLWTQSPIVQQHQIDIQEIEELFGQKDCQSKCTAPPTRGEKSRASSRSQVSILDPKRGLHVEIFLKQFKRSNQTLVDDIRHGNSESLGAEPLKELLKLLPGKDEAKKLKAYRGNAAKLSMADSFMHLLIQVPSYLVRIESMLLKEEFPVSCEAVRRDFNILRSAVKELMCCTELHAVLHLVLQAGNILNAGGAAGNAVGFKLSSLLSLADTKSNKPGMNLLHFVALEAQKKDEKLLDFPLKLSDIQAASRISLEALDAELQVLTSRTRSVEESIQKDTELLQQMDVFLQSATSSLCSLRDSQQQLKKEGDELIDFFCEDRQTFRLDDCFCIFHTFCLRFTCAVKENKEREAKEAARQQTQEPELKRRSWSGGEQVRGAVGLRCSSETDMSTVVLKDDTGLLELLLTPKRRSTPNGHHITPGGSFNSHRTRNPPSSSPLFAANRELSTFLELSNDHKVPQQRGKVASRTNLSSASPKSELKGAGSSPKKMDSQTPYVPSKTTSDSTVISKDGVHDQVETDKPTSYSNQQSDYNNNENNHLENLSHHQTLPDDNSKDVSGVSEKRTLVPELQPFDEEIHHQDETIKNLKEEVVDDSQILNMKDNSKKSEKSEVEIIVTKSPSPPQDSEEEEDKVIVWCVTGVCEPAGESAQTGGENPTSSPPPNLSSEPRLDSEKSGSIPISCQPVSRCTDSPLLSSPGLHPTEPAPAGPGPGPGLTADASEEDNVTSNQEKTPKKYGKAPVSSRNKTATSSKQSTKNLNYAKPQNTSMKPSTANATPTNVRSVSNTTSSENQNLRRVVPITKANRGAKHLDKPSAHNQSSFRTVLTSLPSTPIRHSHPSTAPQRSKMPESKELRDQKVSGIATRTQNTDVQRKPTIRKALTKPKTQTEEKMCLLRALTQSDRGSSVSAPVTPLHKSTSLSTPLGFARNTASSSFRRTNVSLSNTGSPKTSKTSSSVSRTGSVRLVTSTSTSPLRTSGNIRSNRALLPKDHRDNSTVSDKSTHFRDSSKTTRVNWR